MSGLLPCLYNLVYLGRFVENLCKRSSLACGARGAPPFGLAFGRGLFGQALIGSGDQFVVQLFLIVIHAMCGVE